MVYWGAWRAINSILLSYFYHDFFKTFLNVIGEVSDADAFKAQVLVEIFSRKITSAKRISQLKHQNMSYITLTELRLSGLGVKFESFIAW